MFIFKGTPLEELFSDETMFIPVMPTERMLRYIPLESEMALTYGKLHQRLTFYHESNFTPYEEQAIQEFKIWCKGHGNAIPECNEEILRALYARKMDSKSAYEAILSK